MSAALPLLAVAMMVGTLAVLVVGVVTFALGPGFNARYGTRLMAMRVVLQGAAVAALAAMLLL
jgi:hypothetical protein